MADQMCEHYACRCARAAELAAMGLTLEAIQVHEQRVCCRDLRQYCDKTQCPNGGRCKDDSRCIGSLKRKLPVTPSEVKPT